MRCHVRPPPKYFRRRTIGFQTHDAKVVFTSGLEKAAAFLRNGCCRVTAAEAAPSHAPRDGWMTGTGRSPGSRIVAAVRLPKPALRRTLSGMMDSGSPLTVAGAASELPRRTRCAKHLLSATAPNSLLCQLAPAPVPCPQSSGVVVSCQRHSVRESLRDGLPRYALQMGDSGSPRVSSCRAARDRGRGTGRLRVRQRGV